AEGVEKADQLEALKRRGCDVIQGYYISKPLPADQFLEFILNTNKPQFQTSAKPEMEAEDIEELESIL
ncbi:MAG: EAL domain-containing protein, partial [Termitinemataceae bacterium]